MDKLLCPIIALEALLAKKEDEWVKNSLAHRSYLQDGIPNAQPFPNRDDILKDLELRSLEFHRPFAQRLGLANVPDGFPNVPDWFVWME